MNSSIRDFRDLECWKKCRQLRRFVANTVKPALPPDEKYRLADQILRAARSTTANIAEGSGRYHVLDNAKFCSNARASCYEVLDHLITARDEGLLTEDHFAAGVELTEEAMRLVGGYLHYLRRLSRRAG